MTRVRRGNKPIFFDAVVATASKVLETEAELSADKAGVAAVAIARSLCDQFKRTSIYVPCFVEPMLDERNERLLAAYGRPGPDGSRPFTAERVREIAAQQNLTEAAIYKIIKRSRVEEAAKREKVVPEAAT